jgi:hypothetical protein
VLAVTVNVPPAVPVVTVTVPPPSVVVEPAVNVSVLTTPAGVILRIAAFPVSAM